jgi:hypothetical protein
VPLKSPRPAYAYLILLVSAMLLSGCAAAPTAPEPPNVGPVSGRWNQQIWSGSGFAIQTADSLRIVGQRPDPFHYFHEEISVRLEFSGVGEYEVDGSMEQVTGGDLVASTSCDAVVVITDYLPATDDRSARVRGNMTLTSTDPDRPWRFESGAFDVPIFARWEDVPCVICRPGID